MGVKCNVRLIIIVIEKTSAYLRLMRSLLSLSQPLTRFVNMQWTGSVSFSNTLIGLTW